MRPIEKIKVTVVVDNRVAESKLWGEHGLSLLIEVKAGGRCDRILFDAGQTAEVLLHNLAVLGIDPKSVSSIVFSHGHYDHTGGLTGLLNATDHPIRLIVHPHLWGARANKRPTMREIGSGLQPHRTWPGRIELVQADTPVPLGEALSTTGTIARSGPNDPDMPFVREEHDAWVTDDILDDMALIADLGRRGLFIVTGCCHAGIENTIRHAARIAGNDRIYAIVGGLHLTGAREERMNRTVRFLAGLELEHLVPLHCSGVPETCRLAQELGESVAFGGVGTQIAFP